jgi:Fic family protein
MNASDFTRDSPGRLVKSPAGVLAFVPNPLPPTLALDWDLARLLSDADRAVAELAGVGRSLPNPHLLITPFVRREAVLSSRIEGTQASLSDLFVFEAAPGRELAGSDVREVANYVRALEHGLKRLGSLPLSLRFIRELHEILLKGVRGSDQECGEFRTIQNWIGFAGAPIEEAVFVPPPPNEVLPALDAFETFLHRPGTFPQLVRYALMHYQFEAIHPFRDGNGRIGRLLVSILLCADGLLPHPLLYLSAFFEKNRSDYYRLLLEVSQRGNWDSWLRFFLRGVAAQSIDAVRRGNRLRELRQSYRERLQAARSSALVLKLVDRLFVSPVITAPQATKFLDVTPRAAQLNIDKLTSAGILKEITGQMRYRVYAGTEIILAIEADELEPRKGGLDPGL